MIIRKAQGAVKFTWELAGDICFLFTCPESRIRFHKFDWGPGPEGGDWWMFCTKCGRPVE